MQKSLRSGWTVYGSRTSEVVSRTCWISCKLLSPDQWLKERGIYMRIALFCIMAERTKHIHAQRSFRFLAERHKTRYTLGETTGHRLGGSLVMIDA